MAFRNNILSANKKNQKNRTKHRTRKNSCNTHVGRRQMSH